MADNRNLPEKVDGGLPVPVDEFVPEEDDLNRKSEMPFLDHLEELRQRILWCLGFLFVGIIVGFWLNSEYDLLAVIIKPVAPYLKDGKLMIIRPTEGFMIA